jgi:hypothetical protein
MQPEGLVNSLSPASSLFVPSFLEHSLPCFGWKSKAPYANPAMQVNHCQLAPNE